MDVTYAITGALTAKLNGQTMIKKNEIYLVETINLNGAGTKIRTRDLMITNQLLYQLSYTGNNIIVL